MANEEASPVAKPKFITIADVRSRYGGVSPTWIDSRIEDCNFPKPLPFGRTRMWLLEELEAWEKDILSRRAP